MKKILVIFSILIFSACGKSSDSDNIPNSVISNNKTKTVASSESTEYNKIDWQSMDVDKDGYVSPEEMVNHYKNTGVYN